MFVEEILSIVSGRTPRKSILFWQSAYFPKVLLLFLGSFLLTSKYIGTFLSLVLCSVAFIFRDNFINEATRIT